MPASMTELGPALTGLALGLTASAAWTLANISITAAVRDLGPLWPVWIGQAIGAALLALALPWFPASDGAIPWGWLVFSGVNAAIAYVTMFRAFEGGPVSVTSPIIAGWALVASLVAVAMGEALPWLRALGGLLVLIGAMATAARGSTNTDNTWRRSRADTLGSAAVSALTFGLMIVGLGPVAKALGPIASILAVWAVEWAVLLPFLIADRARLRSATPRMLGPIVLFALGETAGFLAVDIGGMVSPMAIVGPAASVGSLFTVIMARYVLKEAVRPELYLWSALVVAGIALLGVS